MAKGDIPIKSRPKQSTLSLPRYRWREGLPAISLFTGAGGLDLGIESAGDQRIKSCSWVEKDEICRETLALNNPTVRRAMFSDVAEVTPAQIMSVTGLERGETFVLMGGPPCQAFSTAGLRQGLNETRGSVTEHYFELIRALKPRFFVFENVRGLLSVAIKHRAYEERMASQKLNPGEPDLEDDQRLGSVFRAAILQPVKRLGYEIVYGLVNAADYGTAQVRHRLVILGSRDKELGSGRFRKITGREMVASDLLPPIRHQLAPYSPIEPWRTLRDAISHLPAPSSDDTFAYSPARRAIWKRIPPGAYWTFIRDNPRLFPEGLQELLGGAYSSGGGKVGFWRRLSWDRPAPTLPTQPQHMATSLCHPEQERPLSVTEYSALQDFPAEYRFAGSKADKYVQIGNAVPVRLGKAIGNLLLAVAGERSQGAWPAEEFEADVAI